MAKEKHKKRYVTFDQLFEASQKFGPHFFEITTDLAALLEGDKIEEVAPVRREENTPIQEKKSNSTMD